MYKSDYKTWESPSEATPGVRYVRIIDVITGLFLIFFVSSAQLPGWDISPISFMTISVAVYLIFTKKWIPKHFIAADRRSFWFYSFLVLWDVVSAVLFKDSGLPVVAVSILCCAGLIISSGVNQFELDRFVHIFFLILVLSLIIFLFSIYSRSFASMIEIFTPLSDKVGRFSPKGLARASHLFGYQITSLCLFFLYGFFFSDKTYFKIFSFVGMILSFWAIYLQGTRSGFAGIFVAFAVMVATIRSARRLLIPVFMVIISFYLVINLVPEEWVSKKATADWSENRLNILERIASVDDLDIRFGMQLFALDVIIDYPLGLRAEGKTWGSLVNSTNIFTGDQAVQAVHNAYLGYILDNGIIPGTMLIVLVLYGVKISWRMLKFSNRAGPGLDMTTAVPICFIADQINALFHNACFINEPFSATLFVLLLAQNSLTIFSERNKYSYA